ncbi:MAG: branched-chain amino acid ABC transporter permease [Acidothermaceae bacterium]
MTKLGLTRGAIFVAALACFPFVVHEHWILNIAVFTLMYAGLSSAWNLVGGYAGYPSLGHAAFFGLGAYVEAIWFNHHSIGSGYAPFFVLPLVGLVVMIASIPIAWVAMRTRSDVFAIVTITLLFVVQTLAFNLRSLTNGSQGIGIHPPPFALATYERPFYYAFAAILVVAMGLTYLTLRSKTGLSLLAVRSDEDKARGIGVHVTLAKLTGFSMSVWLAAMIGAVWAYYVTFVYPQFAVDPLITIAMVLMTFLGGRATLWGPILGAFILAPSQQYLAYTYGASRLYLLAYAAVFLVIMLFLPRGIIPSISDRRFARGRAARLAALDSTTTEKLEQRVAS